MRSLPGTPTAGGGRRSGSRPGSTSTAGPTRKQSYTFYAGTDDLDAAPARRRVPVSTAASGSPAPRRRPRELGRGPLVYRYSGHGRGGGRLPGLHVLAGRGAGRARPPVDEARTLMDEAVALVNDVGLLAEQMDPAPARCSATCRRRCPSGADQRRRRDPTRRPPRAAGPGPAVPGVPAMAVHHPATIVPRQAGVSSGVGAAPAVGHRRGRLGADPAGVLPLRRPQPARFCGVETHLLGTADGQVLQVPLTYRGAPRAPGGGLAGHHDDAHHARRPLDLPTPSTTPSTRPCWRRRS